MFNAVLLSALLLGTTPDPYKLTSHQRETNLVIIVDYAREARRDPFELLAISYTESRLNAKAVSPTGDVGLFQVNCRVWAKRFGYDTIKKCKEDMLNPKVNVIAAVSILDEHETKYRQCRRKSRYHCYNGGPGWRLSKNREKIEKYAKSVTRRRWFLRKKYLGLIKLWQTSLRQRRNYSPRMRICLPMTTHHSFGIPVLMSQQKPFDTAGQMR